MPIISLIIVYFNVLLLILAERTLTDVYLNAQLAPIYSAIPAVEFV